MYYALEEAAHLLQVRQVTLDRWLRNAGFTLHVLDTPVLSDDQLHALARRYKRSLGTHAMRNGSLKALAQELQALRSRMERMEEVLSQVGQGPYSGDWEDERDERIRALEQAIQRAIAFLTGAAHMPGPHQEPIIITFFGTGDVFQHVPWLRPRWVAALRAALNAGWNIVHLHNGKPGPARAKQIVENLVKLLGAPGNYDPAYVAPSQTLPPPCEYILVPECGVLKLIVPQADETASCEILSDGRECDQLFERLETLRRRSQNLLLRTPPSAVGFSSSLADADYQEGDRCLIMDGISEVHVPFSIYVARAKVIEQKAQAASDFSTLNRLPQLNKIRWRREEAFEAELRRFHVRDICTKQALLRLVQDGIFSPTDRLRESGVLTKPQRADVLDRLAQRLEAKPHRYQLAVLEDETVARVYPQMRRLFWMVKEGHIVLMEMLHDVQDHGSVEVDISISDADLVAAFYDYFEMTLWKRIPTREKSRGRVAKWLRQQAIMLRETDPGSPTHDRRAGELE